MCFFISRWIKERSLIKHHPQHIGSKLGLIQPYMYINATRSVQTTKTLSVSQKLGYASLHVQYFISQKFPVCCSNSSSSKFLLLVTKLITCFVFYHFVIFFTWLRQRGLVFQDIDFGLLDLPSYFSSIFQEFHLSSLQIPDCINCTVSLFLM